MPPEPTHFTADPDDPVQTVLLARQPIYNKAMGVYAYELLFQSDKQHLDAMGEDNATAQVLLNTFLTMGLNNLVGSRLAAIHISEWYLYKVEKLPVPCERVILEFSSMLAIVKETLPTLKKLKTLGFTLMLIDHGCGQELESLMPYIDILKIDRRAVKQRDLPGLVKRYKKYSNLALLSANVESMDEFRFYCDMGFKYCQGNLLSKPRVYQSKSLVSNKVSVMQLLSLLCRTDADFEAIETVVSRDVSISYKLLKLINSAFFALPRKIESIQQAIVMLGKDRLKSWVSMLALNSIHDGPVALMEIAIIRAKMCELLANAAKMPWQDSYFTVGLFSALDVLMKQPLEKLIGGLPLSEEVASAILHHQGAMGQALKCVIAYENSDWSQAQFEDLSSEAVSRAGHQAFLWSSEILRTI